MADFLESFLRFSGYSGRCLSYTAFQIKMTLCGTGVRNYLRAVRKGLRTPHGHNQCVGFK